MPKTSYRFISYLCSITFILFAFLGNVHFWCFYEPFYASEHRTLTLYGKSIPEHIGISEEELDDLTHFTLSYLNDKDASLDRQMTIKGQLREVFTDDEKLHMIDVRNLNLFANKLLVVSGVVFVLTLIYLVVKKYPLAELFGIYKKVLLIVLAIFLLLGAWVFIDFDSFWTNFHHVFFPGNDLWILDLRKDILIMIVPPTFFFHLVSRIFFTFIGSLLLGNFLLYMNRRSSNG
ncbi:MAG: TIGR01906 family membrane protein [Erysipelotrichaceae bacterium]|nr:TIGR01906 family membrane protein [Erysipelotrichaceae bacterium]